MIIQAKIPSLKCNQCGSSVILVKHKTQKLEYNFSAITINTYRCSNKSCQESIDKKTEGRIKLQKEQEIAKKKRLKSIIKTNKKKLKS